MFYKITFLVLSFLILSCSKEKELENNENNSNSDTIVTNYVSTDIKCWLTNQSKKIYFKRQNIALNFDASREYEQNIVVNSTQTYQSIDGFGFALTEGSAYLINRLSLLKKDSILHELFDTTATSIGINYLRISIGASDLSTNVFSYDDVQNDTLLSNFDLSYDKDNLVPILKSIVKINPKLKILACPWSAPSWMKTNKNFIGGSLEKKYFGVYANYFVKYIQKMNEQGIKIDAITPQNEPLNPNNNPSMYMSALDQSEFIKHYLGPRFVENSISTKIICYDHNCDVPQYPLTILKDPEAYQFIDGSAFHLYSGSITALTSVHDAYPEKNIYFTEQWVGGPGNFVEDLKWHIKNLIIGATRNWSKNVIEWNLASDQNYNPHTNGGCTTCLGGITICGANITRNVSYYVIAHASKFVESGSVRIYSNTLNNLPNVAFKTPSGKIVLIVLNDTQISQTFSIKYNNKISNITLSESSVATYFWNK